MSKLINKDELIRRTEEYLNQWKGNTPLKYSEFNTWGDIDKQRWKNAKATVYARMRSENREKMKDFWLKQMDNGSFQAFFHNCGLRICCGKVIFEDNAAPILTSYIKNVVLPKLEKEMNVKGVKLRSKRISGMTQDIFNWEHAEIKEG